MVPSIDPKIALAAMAATPAERHILCTPFLCPDNLSQALAMLWVHDIHVPTIAVNPWLMRELIDAMWYEEKEPTAFVQLLNRMILRRHRPIRVILSPFWHLGTFRGYGYGSPIHASSLIPRGRVVIYDSRARWFVRIRVDQKERMTSEIVFDGLSSVITIV